MSVVRDGLKRLRGLRSTAGRADATDGVDERDIVFNIVWTGTVFDHLKYFVASQLDQSNARCRFISNGCSGDQIAAMERFASSFPDRVSDVFVINGTDMVGHGVALDAVLDDTDDGEFFALIDPDIRAAGPFVADFTSRLVGPTAAISSGRGVWADTDRIPAGHPGVNGEYFYSTDGFLFGSPHFAIYRRAAVDAARSRWGVGFGSGGPDLADAAKQRLTEEGHNYIVYDTGKLMNAFLQFDGHAMEHMEHDNLMHIGGLSHFLSPPAYVEDENGDQQPDWVRYAGMEVRFGVAQYTAQVLMEMVDHRPPPEIPSGLEPAMAAKLTRVRGALIDMVERYDHVVR